jgi:protein-tyrosine phosphatase
MNVFNKSIYSFLCLSRHKKIINLINNIANINDYNKIIPYLYIGNINSAYDINFLIEHKIEAIVNCTENESFSEYFNDKLKFRLSINDSKEKNNIINFKNNILETIDFIENCIENKKIVYVHCYWGLMRSATVIAAYLIKKYRIKKEDAIEIIREQRPKALVSIYNFNEVLQYVEDEINLRKES